MKKTLALLAVLLLPVVTFGQDIQLGDDGVFKAFTNIINKAIPFIIGLAVFIFIIGLIRYVNAGGEEDKIKAARNTIIWGLIIIFVMFSAVGIVNLLNNTFGFNNTIDNSKFPKI